MMVSISPIGALGSMKEDTVVSELISDLEESSDIFRVSNPFSMMVSPDILMPSKPFSITVSSCTTVCAIKEVQVDKVKINPTNRLIMDFKFDTSFVLTKILQFLC
jgi:hypothetical protein